MAIRLLGDPDGGPPVLLNHSRFSYAGKFVMSSYGKALFVREVGIQGAIAFNRDRTTSTTVWFRYLTVREGSRGAGIGARLADGAARRLQRAGADEIRIAVNNPFAYYACYKAGFGFTGEETGIAELVLTCPGDRSRDMYRRGLVAYRDRVGLSEREQAFLDEKFDSGPPEPIETSIP